MHGKEALINLTFGGNLTTLNPLVYCMANEETTLNHHLTRRKRVEKIFLFENAQILPTVIPLLRDYNGLKSVDALARQVLSTGCPWRKKREASPSHPGRKEYVRLMKHNSGSPWSSSIFLERW